MQQPHITLKRAPFGAPSEAILPALKTLRPTRGVGVRLSQYTTDVLSGKKPACHVLDRVLLEAVGDPRVPIYSLLHVPARLRWWMLGARGLLGQPCLYEASLRETDAVAALDPVQHRLLRNGVDSAALGELYAALPLVSAQLESTDLLQVAVLTAIARRESAHGGRRSA